MELLSRKFCLHVNRGCRFRMLCVAKGHVVASGTLKKKQWFGALGLVPRIETGDKSPIDLSDDSGVINSGTSLAITSMEDGVAWGGKTMVARLCRK